MSRSLAHGETRDIEQVYHEVLSQWPPEALGKAAKEVLVISGMAQTENTESENHQGDVQAEPLEKSLPVNINLFCAYHMNLNVLIGAECSVR